MIMQAETAFLEAAFEKGLKHYFPNITDMEARIGAQALAPLWWRRLVDNSSGALAASKLALLHIGTPEQIVLAMYRMDSSIMSIKASLRDQPLTPELVDQIQWQPLSSDGTTE